jgi:sulfate permease, SulP family
VATPLAPKAPSLGIGTIGDLVAGISVALVVIPQSLAYAELAGMSPVQGLYASALPPLAAAAFASSPYLQTGPVAITSLLTFGALSTIAAPGSPEYVELGVLLTAIVGAVRVLLGLWHGGLLAYLMSQPMMMGFVPAAAVLIVASQLPAAVGARTPDDDVIQSAAWALGHLDAWQLGPMALSAVVLALVLGGRRVHALFPGVLVSAGLGILATSVLGYDGTTVGQIPEGFPAVSLALPWSEIPTLAVSGTVIAIVGFTEAASISRRFAAEDRHSWSADRELISQGAANLASGLSGGFPCGGSFSRSSVNRMSGARTRLSGAITGIAVLVFLPFAGVLSPLPNAVLAAIVIGAVLGLVRLGPILRLARYSPPQFAVAAITFAVTLLLSPRIDHAVLIGVGLSILVHLWRTLELPVDARYAGDTLHLTPRGVLWFATSQKLDDAFLDALASNPDATRLHLHLTGLGRIDLTGALALRALVDRAQDAGLEAVLDGVPPQSRRLTEQLLGCDRNPLS